MRLSNKMVKEMDRVGGAILMIPWPIALGSPPTLVLDQEVPATTEQHRKAEQMLASEIDRIKQRGIILVPVRSIVTLRKWPDGLPLKFQEAYFLGTVIIGSRWVHATGNKASFQKECWLA